MLGHATTIKEALVDPSRLALIRQGLTSGKVRTRTALAAELCRRFSFLDPLGKPRVFSCLKALRELESAGHIQLPPRELEIVLHWKPRRLPQAVPAPKGVPEEVGQIKDLVIELVNPSDTKAMRTWNELMAREHPQGERRLVGRQLRYLVGSAHGWLGAVGFSASALYLEARDRWIGWDAPLRHAHQERVVNLSRFLIRPGVHCRNLASFVLGAVVRRMGKDFEARYGYEPWLLESFVDARRHVGTCFQAANWELVGRTKGRGRNDQECRAPESVKDVYVYPLHEDFRRRMGISPKAGSYLRPLPVESGLSKEVWVEQEFGEVEFGDKRLRDRLLKIVGDRFRKPDASYLAAVGGDRAAVKGFYYFIDHPGKTLNPETILATHRTRTIERMMAHDLVLVVQDTTDLNFSTRPHTAGLGFIGTNQTEAESQGLKMHTSFSLTPEGLPLGVLRTEISAPERKGEEGKSSVGRPIEEKKTFRWIQGYRDCVSIAKKMPRSRILNVMDREADIFELFMEAEPTRHRVGLLIRAKYNRCLEDTERKLWEELGESPTVTQVEVLIPRQRCKKAKGKKSEREGLPARNSILTVRYAPISITSTRSDLRSEAAIKLWAVYAVEEHPPAGAEKIEWMLLTTEHVLTAEDAIRILGYYCRRWRIEEWHRILKSGCVVQEHQHKSAERLARAITIDAVLAWRIQLMVLLGREVPDLPAAVLFESWEVKVLVAVREERTKKKNQSPPLLGEAVIETARLGGYLARRSDPPPGFERFWMGLIELCAMAIGYRLASTRAP